MHYPWEFDAKNQVIRTPWLGGVITFGEIAQWRQDLVYHRHNLSGPWAGWKVRGNVLSSPHGFRVTAEALRLLVNT